MSDLRQRKGEISSKGSDIKTLAAKDDVTPQKKETPVHGAPARAPYSAKQRSWIFLLLIAGGTIMAFYPNIRRYFNRTQDPNWWKKTIIYQVYPRSFKDSNGDGIGDLKGITSRLDYFVFLQTGAIWLSPFYKSPMVDGGYDVANFTEVDPIFGTLDDFDALIDLAHKKNIRVIIDFIPNHTSNQHKWFQESRKGGKNNPYRDYYVWHPGKLGKGGRREPPNNWVGVFSGSMWTFDERRKEYYLHQFTKEQPDLNFRNVKVQQEMMDVLQFWLDRGVDGFRVDAIRHLYESADLTKDEPRRTGDCPSCNMQTGNPNHYSYYSHIHTVNLPEVHQVLKRWRRLFDNHFSTKGKYVLMIAEVFPDGGNKDLMEYYHSGSDMPFNFNLLNMNRSCGGFCVKKLVQDWLQQMPDDKWPNWVVGNHDQPRITQKMGRKLVNAINMVLLLLPGTPTTYQGEEIGMLPIKVSYEDTQDPFGKIMGPDLYKEFSRDPCRSPMQWNAKKNAGFSEADTTWLPVHPEYLQINVRKQKQNEDSSISFYRKISILRKDETLLKGNFDFGLTTHNIFSFIRFREGQAGYLIAVNFGNRTVETNFQVYDGKFHPPDKFISQTGFVVMNTGIAAHSKVPNREFIQLNQVSLEPSEGVVIRFWPGY